jgi:hypothetical protein
MNPDNYDWERLEGLGFSEDARDSLKKACWKGYHAIGVKKKGGRTVPNCVPLESKHGEGDIATAEMTPNFLPEEPGEGDEKNPQMNEGTHIRMPRMEVIKKAANKNGQLAMHASANISDYSEIVQSTENNGAMIITQLRVAQDRIAILLDMLSPDDNLPPWAATKVATAGVFIDSVSDYIRFGEEG